MYLMHMLVLGPVSAWMREQNWATPVAILGTAVISFVSVGVIAVLIRRIPRVGKWLMG